MGCRRARSHAGGRAHRCSSRRMPGNVGRRETKEGSVSSKCGTAPHHRLIRCRFSLSLVGSSRALAGPGHRSLRAALPGRSPGNAGRRRCGRSATVYQPKQGSVNLEYGVADLHPIAAAGHGPGGERGRGHYLPLARGIRTCPQPVRSRRASRGVGTLGRTHAYREILGRASGVRDEGRPCGDRRRAFGDRLRTALVRAFLDRYGSVRVDGSNPGRQYALHRSGHARGSIVQGTGSEHHHRSTLIERRDLDFGAASPDLHRQASETGHRQRPVFMDLHVFRRADGVCVALGSRRTQHDCRDNRNYCGDGRSSPQFAVSIRHRRLQCLSLMWSSNPLVRVVAQTCAVGICASQGRHPACTALGP